MLFVTRILEVVWTVCILIFPPQSILISMFFAALLLVATNVTISFFFKPDKRSSTEKAMETTSNNYSGAFQRWRIVNNRLHRWLCTISNKLNLLDKNYVTTSFLLYYWILSFPSKTSRQLVACILNEVW